MQIVDIISIFPVGENLYIIQTTPFNDHSLLFGAGRPLRAEQITKIIEHLRHL